MAAPSSPKDWLDVLTKKMDARMPEINRLRSYSNGNAPMPEMNENLREAWQIFQRRARGGFGYLIASALANRIVPTGCTVGGEAATVRKDDATGDETPAQAAARLYRDTMLDVAIGDVILEAFQVRVGYLIVEKDEDGPVVTVEKAETFYAKPDPLRPYKAKAGVQIWRDEDDDNDYARLWIEGKRVEFKRESRKAQGDGKAKVLHTKNYTPEDWEMVVDSEQTYEGGPPVWVFENRDGFGEYERHIDAIDRVHYGVLNRLVVMAAQAFRQRAIKGDLPEEDDDGNSIDWAATFVPTPGALWDLPEGIDIWESQQADILPLLAVEDSDLRALSACSETPLASLVPDGANQTAEGAAFQKEAIVFKANDRLRRFSPIFARVMVRLLEIEGFSDVPTVEITWEPTDRVSTTEKYDAASKAKAAGESWQSIARNILGYTPEQIRQDALDRANEQLTMQLLAPPVPAQAPSGQDGIPAPNGAPGTPPTAPRTPGTPRALPGARRGPVTSPAASSAPQG